MASAPGPHKLGSAALLGTATFVEVEMIPTAHAATDKRRIIKHRDEKNTTIKSSSHIKLFCIIPSPLKAGPKIQQERFLLLRVSYRLVYCFGTSVAFILFVLSPYASITLPLDYSFIFLSATECLDTIAMIFQILGLSGPVRKPSCQYHRSNILHSGANVSLGIAFLTVHLLS